MFTANDKHGNEYDFDPSTTFEAGLKEGCAAGYILDAAGVHPDYIESITGPIRLVINETLTEADTLVSLRLGVPSTADTTYKPYVEFLSQQLNIAEGENRKQKKQTSREVTSDLYCSVPDFLYPGYGMAKAKVAEKPVEILLGESKYFGVKKKNGEEKHEIVELTSIYGSAPTWPDLGEGWGKVETDIWGTKPIEIISKDTNQLPGVYWEKKWFDNTDNSNKTLDAGIIRIIGRYWEEGKEENYKVKLKASFAGSNVETAIKVIKPSKVGDNKNTYMDVRGNTVPLDEKIIKYSGEYGILPQIIKAQIQNESNFRAAYRYEPFQNAWGISTNSIYTKNRYKIKSSSDLGKPTIPEDHTNVYPNNYWGYQNTIWEFFYNHSSTLNPSIEFGSKEDLYPQRNSKGNLLWFKSAAEHYNNVFKSKVAELSTNPFFSTIETVIIAHEAANSWLRYEYAEGRMNTGIAQTRMSASYGILQVTYYYARENRGFVENDKNYPEKLNESESIKMAIKALATDFLVEELEDSSTDNKIFNWDGGFETRMKFALNLYNGRRNKNSYGIEIIKNSVKIKIN
ncbi:hypothetical protein ACFLTH_08365 [Bacteroidota bacterium]